MQGGKTGTEERAGLVERIDSSLHQQGRKDLVDAEFCGKARNLVLVGVISDYPLSFFLHN